MQEKIHTRKIELKDYFFPVREESKIIIPRPGIDLIDPDNPGMYLPAPNYKAILREDSGEVISIMGAGYQLVSNQEVIEKALNQLEKTDLRYEIDQKYSFADSNRCKLSIKFPEIELEDDNKNKSPLSFYLHNSYDGSEGVRGFWGAIRAICTNGMVFGHVLGKFYARHTGSVNLDNLAKDVYTVIEKLPDVQTRIDQLRQETAQAGLYQEIEKHCGKTAAREAAGSPEALQGMSMWVLYNLLTRYIAHRVKVQQQTRYQIAVSKIFQL